VLCSSTIKLLIVHFLTRSPTQQVRVGHDNLVGEVIRISGDQATIQVYEETGTPLVAIHAFPP
jgi:vacuolar-type H+-ATPase catalytic subunit A/Vma1